MIKTVLSLFLCSPTVCLVWLLLTTNALPACLNTLHANGITFDTLVKPGIFNYFTSTATNTSSPTSEPRMFLLQKQLTSCLSLKTPVIEEGSIVAQTREAPAAAIPMAKSKRGVGNPNGVPEVCVGNPNGVPEVSHVVFYVAETDAVSKERFSRSSTVSFALDSSIGGVSTVHNHRSSRFNSL